MYLRKKPSSQKIWHNSELEYYRYFSIAKDYIDHSMSFGNLCHWLVVSLTYTTNINSFILHIIQFYNYCLKNHRTHQMYFICLFYRSNQQDMSQSSSHLVSPLQKGHSLTVLWSELNYQLSWHCVQDVQ